MAIRKCSIIFFCYFFLLFIQHCSSQTSSNGSAKNKVSTLEVQALYSFKQSLSDPLNSLSSWNASSPSAPCDWRGVSCSSGRVSVLRLPRFGLSGTISASSIASLPALRRLFLQSNSFSGSLPSVLFLNTTVLQAINLSNNLLSGPLVPQLPRSLQYLDLSSNSLSGDIPPNFTSNSIQFLSLAYNRITGAIPASIGESKSLEYLWLDGNLLQGSIPAALQNCSNLQHLSLRGNEISGEIPAGLGRISALGLVDLSHNNLSGEVPASLVFNNLKLKVLQLGFNAISGIGKLDDGRGRSSLLQIVDLQSNKIGGSFPEWLVNLMSLTELYLSANSFSGSLPVNVSGRFTKNLRELRLARNEFVGEFPAWMASCIGLQVLDLENNQFSGEIPEFLGSLKGLKTLSLGGNSFSSRLPTSIGNLTALETLSLRGNNLTGDDVMGILLGLQNVSFLDVSENDFSGEIPAGISKFVGLWTLNLSGNRFSGGVPGSIGNLVNLRTLDLSRQNLSGELPTELSALANLQYLTLSENSFSGNVPTGLSSLTGLRYLNLTGNQFTSGIPAAYGFLPRLSSLSLSGNKISGKIPAEIGNCSELVVLELRGNNLYGGIVHELSKLSRLKQLDLGENSLTGSIPPELSDCPSLTSLRLDGNNLTGNIPDSLGDLSILESLNLAGNNLLGEIPPGLSKIASLRILNLSDNSLSGEIPASLGSRFPSLSFSGNPNLCGSPLPRNCGGGVGSSGGEKKVMSRVLMWILIAVGSLALFILSMCCLITAVVLWRRWRMKNGIKKRSPSRSSGGRSSGDANGKLVMFNNKITYAETLEATRQFDEEHVLSRGRNGPVFKAIFTDGTVLSIRRFTSAVDDSAFRKEAELLGKVKHRNLTVLRGYYLAPDARLLIYDYMPNGNLATLLQEASHQDGHTLNWPMRHLIALGIARGLSFLHASSLAHGDVNPQNVLFDADFEAHLSDFGMEKLKSTAETTAASTSSTTKLGSLGYSAPEAASTERATSEGDVYSFGIMLLELLTGRRPAAFAAADEDIVKWVKRQLQRGAVAELLEPGLLDLDPDSSEWEEFLLGVKVGLLCTALDPLDRPTMTDVVYMLEGCRVGPDIGSSADPTSQTSPA